MTSNPQPFRFTIRSLLALAVQVAAVACWVRLAFPPDVLESSVRGDFGPLSSFFGQVFGRLFGSESPVGLHLILIFAVAAFLALLFRYETIVEFPRALLRHPWWIIAIMYFLLLLLK